MRVSPHNSKARICQSLASVLFALTIYTSMVIAAEGDPVAIRKWPGGMLSIETHWDFHVVIRPTSDLMVANQLPRVADLALFVPDDLPRTSPIFNAHTIVVGDHSTESAWINHTLTRQPNDAHASWKARVVSSTDDPNSVHVRTLAVGTGNQVGETTPVVIEVDGVTILLIPSRAFAIQPTDALAQSLATVGEVDVVYFDCEGDTLLAPESLHEAWGELKPRYFAMGDTRDVRDATRLGHNTFAIAKSTHGAKDEPKTIEFSDVPWQMSDELKTLFDAMDKSCDDSQSVFAKLSTAQMNFRPSNGTHTPRWNAEHMMGRQLLFFSQIYHTLEPSIAVQDLNPKQMPPDYVAAHNDWTGAEEAMQMQRVKAFTRRFAYLLDGLDLDQPAPSSRWTPRGLLVQMARHYSEHTANTVKKFELPEWPQE